MHAADPRSLYTLTTFLTPKVVHRHHVRLFEFIASAFLGKSAGTKLNTALRSPDDVDIVQTQRVAGLDATTISASDTQGLGRWLSLNGFAWNSSLAAWLAPYVTHHWLINAFRFAPGSTTQSGVTSELLRMSFYTNSPYFPYSEPSDQRDADSTNGPRLLRVFMLSPMRMAGAMMPNAQNAVWPGHVSYAAPLPNVIGARLATALAVDPKSIPPGTWLTTFEDNSSPRPGYVDVVFVPSADKSSVGVPPIYQDDDDGPAVPVDVLALLLGLLVYLGYGSKETPSRLRGAMLAVGSVCLGAFLGFLTGMTGAMAIYAIYMAVTPVSRTPDLSGASWLIGLFVVAGGVIGARWHRRQMDSNWRA
jgi:hypothetical protein